MNAEEKKQVQAKIQEGIRKLEQDIPKLEKQTRPIAPDNAIGRLSRMEAIGNKNVIEATLRTSQQKLSKLKVMLQKVDDEGFGLCRGCDDPIPLPRLLAMPEKDLCVECSRNLEF